MNPNKYKAGSEFTGASYNETRTSTYEARARAIREAENEARPGRPRIQPEEIKYIRNASEALPDLDLFLSLV